MAANLPAALAPSCSLELTLALADSDLVVSVMRFPGIAMVSAEIRQFGLTRTQAERPVDAAALDAALLAVLASAADVPSGVGLTLSFRRAGRVELERSCAAAVARGHGELGPALDVLWGLASASDAEFGAVFAAAWAGV